MRVRHRTAIAILFLTVASIAFAQTTAVVTAPKEAQALLIVQRSLSVSGAGVIVPNQTIQVTGTLTLQGNTPVLFPVVFKSRGTRQLRTELSTSNGVRLTIVSGGHGSIQQPDGSVRNLIDDNVIALRVNHIPVLSLLSEVASDGVAVQYLGNSIVDGSSVNIVAVGLYSGATPQDAQQLQSRTRMVYYIDANSGLVNRFDLTHYAENNPTNVQKVETHLSDYRLVSGVRVPFRQDTYVEGRLLFSLTLDSVTFGVLLMDSDFTVAQ